MANFYSFRPLSLFTFRTLALIPTFHAEMSLKKGETLYPSSVNHRQVRIISKLD